MKVLWAILLGALAVASAKPQGGAQRGARDYYHGAAHKYVAGRMQEAAIEAEEGLRAYPDDEALKALVEQLKKLKDQKKKEQGSGGSSQQGNGEEEKDRQDPQAGQGGEKEPQDKEEGAGGEDKGEEQDKQPPPDAGGEGEEKAGDSAGQAPAPVKPGEMSKEDAERLLNSFQDDEKKEHRQMQRARKKVEVEQDW